jgi:hypothetical protein
LDHELLVLKQSVRVLNFLGALKGHAEFPLFTFSSLEDQAAPQNSFIFIKCVDSIPTAPTNLLHLPSLIEAFNNNKPFNNNGTISQRRSLAGQILCCNYE